MADTYDGSIHINSSVDASGFRKGAKEIIDGAKKLAESVNEAGKSKESAGELDTSKAQKSVQDLGDAFERVKPYVRDFNNALSDMDAAKLGSTPAAELEGKIKAGEEALARMKDAAAKYANAADPDNDAQNETFERQAKALNDYTMLLEEAKRRLAAFKEQQESAANGITVQTTVDTTGVEEGSGRIKNALNSVRNAFANVEESIRNGFNGLFKEPIKDGERLEGDLQKDVSAIADAFHSLTQAKSIPEAYKKLEQLQYLLNDLGRKKYTINGVEVKGFETEQFQKWADKYNQFQQDLINSARTAGGVFQGTAEAERQAIERFNETVKKFDTSDVGEQRDVLEDLQQQAENFANGFRNTDALDRMKEKIHELTVAFQKSGEAAEQQPEYKAPYMQGWDEAEQKIKDFPTLSWQIKSAFEGALTGIATVAGGAMAQVSSAINSPLSALNRLLGMVALKAKDAASGLLALVGGSIKAGLNGIAAAAQKAAESLMNLAKNAVSGALNNLKKGISGVTSALTGMGKKATGVNGAFSGGFKTVLKYAFGIRSLYYLFRKLRTALTEGFNNVLNYDTNLKATVDDFKLSLDTLKNSVGAAVAPIAQVVLPILTKIIDTITEAINHFGMLTAALTGQKQYTRASKEQAKAYGEEQKKAKELQKTVAGFDDLTILQEQDDNDSSGANGPTNAGFETVPIENGISALADALKDMWEKADFSALGAMLGERLRDALNSIPWESIKDILRRIAMSIATFLNGFLEVPGLFEAIGRTLAEVLNSAFEFLNAFVHTLHWDSLGAAIRDGILGFLDNIDWNLIFDTFYTLGAGIATAIGQIVSDPELPTKLGQGIANIINSAFQFIYGFVHTLPWGYLGTAIHDGILGFLTNIDWTTIYATMTEAGTGIGTALENALDDPTLWSTLFTTVSNAITALFLALYNFITTPDWKSIGASIATGLNDGVENFPWELVANTLSSAVNAVFDLLLNFVANFDFYAFGEHVGNLISDTIGGIEWERVGGTLGLAVSGLFDFFNGLFENTDWEALGEAVMATISSFFQNFKWESVGQFISNVVIGLLDFLHGLFKGVNWGMLPTQVVLTIARIFSGVNWPKLLYNMFRALGLAFLALVKMLIGTTGAIFTAGRLILSGLLKGILYVMSNIGKWIKTNIFDKIIDAIENAFGIASPAKEMVPLGLHVIEGFLKGFIDPIADIGNFLKEHVGVPFIDGVKSIFHIGEAEPALEDAGEGTIEGFKDGAESGMDDIESWLESTVTDPITDGISSNLGTDGTPVTTEDGMLLMEGLYDGVEDGTQNLDSWLQSTLTDPLADGISDNLGLNGTSVTEEDGKLLMDGLFSGMEDGAGDIDSWMSNNVTDPITSGIESPLGIYDGSSSTFGDYGTAMMSSMKSGISDEAEYVTSAVDSLADAMEKAVTDKDWKSVGEYILDGIYDGIKWGWDWLVSVVKNLASSLFDAACAALGISSPSKEFAWIGEMVTEGLSGGLEDNGKTAIDAISAITKGITQEAREASPQIGIETVLDGSLKQLDATLLTFSDRIVTGFQQMIDALGAIAADAGLVIPQAAMGAITPYASRISATARSAPDMETIMELIAAQNADKLTKADLREVLEAVARDYFHVELYLGDEQVARSANRGNVRLNRRYNPVGN